MENDAISRSAALEKLCDGCNSRNNTPVPRCGDICSDFKEILKLPTLDVAPVVHARWVGGKYYNDVYGYEKTCTACQTEYVVGFDYLFCPYCGAKMDGEVNERP